MKPTTDQILAQCDTIRELSEKATPGPWNTESDWPRVLAESGKQIVQVPSRLNEKNRGPATPNTLLIANSRTFAPSAAHALKVAIEAIRTLEFEVGGRLPADSSDSITVEAIHIRRVLAALQQITGAFKIPLDEQAKH